MTPCLSVYLPESLQALQCRITANASTDIPGNWPLAFRGSDPGGSKHRHYRRRRVVGPKMRLPVGRRKPSNRRYDTCSLDNDDVLIVKGGADVQEIEGKRFKKSGKVYN